MVELVQPIQPTAHWGDVTADSEKSQMDYTARMSWLEEVYIAKTLFQDLIFLTNSGHSRALESDI